MTKASVVRGIVASMFAISTAAAGLALGTSAAGAGAPAAPNCTVTVSPFSVQDVPPETEPSHCATLEVTKVVTGAPADGTTFTVGVDCVLVKKLPPSPDGAAADALPPGQTPPFTTTLTFPANGGTQDVFITEPGGDCTVTETPPPGCTLTSIDPVTTHIDKADVFPVTVTNDCPAPPQTPAQAAVAVVVAPRFTG